MRNSSSTVKARAVMNIEVVEELDHNHNLLNLQVM